MAFVLSTVMDALAQELINDGVTARAFGYPLPNPTPPCAIVGYPTKLDFDLTFHALGTTGKVKLAIPVWFVVGKVLDKSARDALSAVLTGALGIKESLDGNLAGHVDYANVIDCLVEVLTISGVEYLTAKFEVEVVV